MKKISILILALFLCACGKKMPKLVPITVTKSYDETIEFKVEDFLDLSKFSQKQIDELKKNGTINYESIEYDEQGKIKKGSYIIKVRYEDDLVRSTLIIEKDTSNNPKFDAIDVEYIEVEQDDIDFDFSEIIHASSPLGIPVTLEFDKQYINFAVVDKYPLVVTAKDEQGNLSTITYDIKIIEKEVVEEEEEEKEEETVPVVTPAPSTPAVRPTQPTRPSNPAPTPAPAPTPTPTPSPTPDVEEPTPETPEPSDQESGDNN